MKQFRNYVFGMFGSLLLLGIMACSNLTQQTDPVSGEELNSSMGFCIKLPGKSSARAVYYNSEDAVYYKIIVSRDGKEVVNKLGKPGECIMLSITEEGTYSIYATAYDCNEKLIAEGVAEKTITLEDGWVKFSVLIYPKYKSVDVEVEIIWANSGTNISESDSNYMDIIEDEFSSLYGDIAFTTISDYAVYYWDCQKHLRYVKATKGTDSFKFYYYPDTTVSGGVILSIIREYACSSGYTPATLSWRYAPGKYIIRQISDYGYVTYSYVNNKYHKISCWSYGDLTMYYDSNIFSGGFGYLSRFNNISASEVSAENSCILNFGREYEELNSYLKKITEFTK